MALRPVPPYTAAATIKSLPMTSQEDVFIREVDEDLTQDKQIAFLRRYGPLLGGAALLLLVVVGGAEVLEGRQEAARAEASEAYAETLQRGAEPGALLSFADTAGGGYAALARMRAAGLFARAGETGEALTAYALVYGDDDLPAALRDLARVRAGYIALEEGGAAADGIVVGVGSEALLPFAREVSGLAAMARADYRTAAATFRAIEGTETAPADLRGRAGGLAALAEAGESGTPLEATSDPDDFLAEFGRTLTSGVLSGEDGEAAVAPGAEGGPVQGGAPTPERGLTPDPDPDSDPGLATD